MSDNIDKQNRREFERRKRARREEDVRKGLASAKGAQWGDYSVNRSLEKTLKDYHKFKDPRDRAKIKQEYFGKEKEYRNKVNQM